MISLICSRFVLHVIGGGRPERGPRKDAKVQPKMGCRLRQATTGSCEGEVSLSAQILTSFRHVRFVGEESSQITVLISIERPSSPMSGSSVCY
jgi:hypothetical protein